jgi:hypothetical protein
LEHVMDKVHTCYAQTFWSLHPAWEAHQAAIALAKRGDNVDHMFLLWGSGGVGLSLISSHLHAIFGHDLHKFYDPNVFYTDEELRKQIEMLAGGILFTGQERPVGNRQDIREDLWKKFASADGIAGRMPYGIVTKMFRIVGFKRLEMNHLMTFRNVTEADFESILRRSLIVRIAARFFDRAYLEKRMKNSEDFGIFARDPTMKEFMTSRPACAAGIRLQQMFEEETSAQGCRDLIVNYTRSGGDRGMTETHMRSACGFGPRPRTGAASDLAAGLPDPGDDAVTGLSKNLHDAIAFLVNTMLDEQKEVVL